MKDYVANISSVFTKGRLQPDLSGAPFVRRNDEEKSGNGRRI